MRSERRGALVALVLLLAAWGWPSRRSFPLRPEALEAGREAARLAPGHPAPQRFLAQAYWQVSWSAQASRAWQAYLEAGGAVDASVERQLLEAARYFLNQGQPAAAAPFVEAVAGREPAPMARLDRARRAERFGAEAVDAVDAGREALEAGQPAVAAERPIAATEPEPDYAEAWTELAPVLERLGRSEAAARA